MRRGLRPVRSIAGFLTYPSATQKPVFYRRETDPGGPAGRPCSNRRGCLYWCSRLLWRLWGVIPARW